MLKQLLDFSREIGAQKVIVTFPVQRSVPAVRIGVEKDGRFCSVDIAVEAIDGTKDNMLIDGAAIGLVNSTLRKME